MYFSKNKKENLAPEKEDITWFTFSDQNIIKKGIENILWNK